MLQKTKMDKPNAANAKGKHGNAPSTPIEDVYDQQQFVPQPLLEPGRAASKHRPAPTNLSLGSSKQSPARGSRNCLALENPNLVRYYQREDRAIQ
jgi:hypothetical protein